MRNRFSTAGLLSGLLGLWLATGCQVAPPHTATNRVGDEVIVAGQRFHTGTPVVTWMDPGGYDAYKGAKPMRPRAEPWPGNNLATLQSIVNQFVLHYDGHGLSKLCFPVLQSRGLNVHFMLDVDGTIYQTLDLQERALHATTSNDRSIGIEIANIGAFPPGETKELNDWYSQAADGRVSLRIPDWVSAPKVRDPHFSGRPAQPNLVRGINQGVELVQYDFTPQQYAALIKLTVALCRIFPRITCDYPRDARGQLIAHKLPDDELAKFHGILGHFHIQTNKNDPGPAFQWDNLIEGARDAQK